MSTRPFVVATLFAVAACPSFAAEPALPASQLDRVTVEAAAPAAPRHDVRAACPGVDAQLQQTLSSAWGRVGQTGTVHVRFRLEGDQVTGVSTSGLAQDYHPYVRKAVRRLACTAGSAQPQDYRFVIVMRDPDEPATREATVALVSED